MDIHVGSEKLAIDSAGLRERAGRIDVLLLDVDGVLTDGAIVLDDRGVETKAFHVRDGSGIACWHRAGKKTAIVTGRSSRVVELRAAELGIEIVRQGVREKSTAVEQILQLLGLGPEQACYVGDDLPDLGAMAGVGFAVAVGDACAEVRAAAEYVTVASGGRGAVREVIELILKTQGRWAAAIAPDAAAGGSQAHLPGEGVSFRS